MNRPHLRPLPIRSAFALPITPSLGLGLALGLSLSLAGCGSPPPEPTASQSPAVRAAVATAERVELEDRVELTGTLVAARTSTVSARVMATITGVHVDAGQAVRRGDLLLEIDPSASDGQVEQAKGALAQARARVPLAERNAERFRALHAENAASQLEVDAAEADLEQAKGAVEQAKGALAAAESLAGDTRVTAPFAGRVVRRWVEVGDLAAPGRPLVEIETDAAQRLAVAVPEHLWTRAALELGDPVPVRLDARPDLGELAGTVAEIVPAADAGSHAFRVEILLSPSPEQASLPTGAAGRALFTAGHRTAITAPKSAVVRHGGLELVVLRSAEGTTETRTVTTGRALDGDRLEVLSGLAGDEELLVGLGAVPPAGSPVEVQR